MSEYKIGTRVNIVKGDYGVGLSGTIKDIPICETPNIPKYRILLDGESTSRVYFDGQFEFEDILEQEVISDDDCYKMYFEMATIVSNNGISVKVNQESKRLSIAYFKVYNSTKLNTATKVARLHFKDEGIECHGNDPFGKKVWIPNKAEIKIIQKLLVKPNGSNKNYTNWEFMCYEWNRECELIPDGIEEYFYGRYDNKYDHDSRLKSAYVPSDTQMPEIWKLK